MTIKEQVLKLAGYRLEPDIRLTYEPRFKIINALAEEVERLRGALKRECVCFDDPTLCSPCDSLMDNAKALEAIGIKAEY